MALNTSCTHDGDVWPQLLECKSLTIAYCNKCGVTLRIGRHRLVPCFYCKTINCVVCAHEKVCWRAESCSIESLVSEEEK